MNPLIFLKLRDWTTDKLWFDSLQRLPSSPQFRNSLCPTSLLFKVYRALFAPGYSDRSLKLTAQSILLYAFTAWTDNFTFYLLLVKRCEYFSCAAEQRLSCQKEFCVMVLNVGSITLNSRTVSFMSLDNSVL